MVVTGSSFRTNQSRYVSAAYRGEDVVVKTRTGCFRVVPVPSEEYTRHYDLVEEFRGSVKEAVESMLKNARQSLSNLDTMLERKQVSTVYSEKLLLLQLKVSRKIKI